jgi:hypothetical protein
MEVSVILLSASLSAKASISLEAGTRSKTSLLTPSPRPLLFRSTRTFGLELNTQLYNNFTDSDGFDGEDLVFQVGYRTTLIPISLLPVGGDGNSIANSQVSNGDDCIAIGSPCTNFHVKGLSCTGSHGVSVAAKGGGSVNVANILVEDVTFTDSLYGARYK